MIGQIICPLLQIVPDNGIRKPFNGGADEVFAVRRLAETRE